jgi:predicted esterase YcpF (UPF0227 family)
MVIKNINISKILDHLYSKVKIFLAEKKFRFNNYKIKYIIEKSKDDCDDIIFIFSARTRPGIKARYNYMNTLRKVKAIKVFILDDFAEDKRGCYYVGRNGKFDMIEAFDSLINTLIQKYNKKRVLFVGSSKGGYASVLYGLKHKNSIIIIGAPQYFIGTYLTREELTSTYTFIMGEYNSENVKILDGYLKDIIKDYEVDTNSKVYIQYSLNDETYSEHIKEIISDLKASKVVVEEEEHNYKTHSEVSLYFPEYLKTSINRVQNETML